MVEMNVCSGVMVMVPITLVGVPLFCVLFFHVMCANETKVGWNKNTQASHGTQSKARQDKSVVCLKAPPPPHSTDLFSTEMWKKRSLYCCVFPLIPCLLASPLCCFALTLSSPSFLFPGLEAAVESFSFLSLSLCSILLCLSFVVCEWGYGKGS